MSPKWLRSALFRVWIWVALKIPPRNTQVGPLSGRRVSCLNGHDDSFGAAVDFWTNPTRKRGTAYDVARSLAYASGSSRTGGRRSQNGFDPHFRHGASMHLDRKYREKSAVCSPIPLSFPANCVREFVCGVTNGKNPSSADANVIQRTQSAGWVLASSSRRYVAYVARLNPLSAPALIEQFLTQNADLRACFRLTFGRQPRSGRPRGLMRLASRRGREDQPAPERPSPALQAQ